MGVEWDQDKENGGPGTNQGVLDGIKYFDCEFHDDEPLYLEGKAMCASFLRYGKANIGGINMSQAITEQYKSEDDLGEEEKQGQREKELENCVVMTTNKKGTGKKIEILGMDQSYNWRSDISKSRDITLQFLKISEVGPPGTLKNLIPNTMHLYLDKNMLYSWDQFFQITGELKNLRVLALTGNKFKKIDSTYFDGKDINKMIAFHLNELVMIDMAMTWDQIDILAPTLIYVEKLYLVRNKCKHICTKF